MRTPREAAAETRASKVGLSDPTAGWTASRESSSSQAVGSHAASSRRTMRDPVRAVEGQWMRRTSSRGWYSRTITSSGPDNAVCGIGVSPVMP